MPFWKASRNDEDSKGRGPLTLLTDHAASKYDDRTVVTSPTGEHRTRHGARLSLRRELLTLEPHGPEADLESGATSYESLPAQANGSIETVGAISPAQEKTRAEVESAIALLKELKKIASPEDLTAIRTALGDLSFTPSNPSSTSLAADDVTLNPLIRWKSIFTSPGAATRPNHPSVLKQTPNSKIPATKEKIYNRADLEKTSALESIIRNPKRHVSGNAIIRTDTPSEFEYKHIGMLELGTLRVMNGTNSPAPSTPSSRLQSSNSNHALAKDEDYYTASEGGGPPSLHEASSNLAPLSPPREQCLTAKLPQAIGSDTLPEPEISRTSSPGRPPGSPMGPRRFPLLRKGTDETAITTISSMDRPLSPLKMYSLVATSNPYLLDDQQKTNELSSRSSLAAIPALMRLNSDCSRNTIDDDGSVYSEDQPRFYAEHPVQKPPSPQTKLLSRLPSMSSSVYTTDTQPTPRPDQHAFLAQRDSGYSSESSLRKQFESVHAEGPHKDSDDRQPTLPLLAPDPLRSIKRAELFTYDLPPPPKFSQFIGTCLSPVPSSRIMYSLPQKASSSGDVTQYITDLTPTTLSAPTTPDAKKKTKLNKLQKKRPLSERMMSSPIIVQGQSPINEVPEIPFEIEAAHHRRMSLNPEMHHLERTFKSVIDSGRRMSTPDLPGQLKMSFPSPAPSPERTGTVINRRRRRSWMEGATHVLSRGKSKAENQRLRASSIETEGTEGDYSNVADFGTVAQVLGSGPYDIAGYRQKQAVPTAHGSLIHPHQLGGNHLWRRADGMNDREASNFARWRNVGRNGGRLENNYPSARDGRGLRDDSSERTTNSIGQRDQGQARQQGPPPMPDTPTRTGWRRNAIQTSQLDDPSVNNRDSDMVVETGHSFPERDEDVKSPAQQKDLSPAPLQTNPLPDVSAASKAPLATPPKGILKNSNTNTPEDASKWELSAKLWRQRRKSIGEGLRNHGSPVSVYEAEKENHHAHPQAAAAEPPAKTPTKQPADRIAQAARDGRISPQRPALRSTPSQTTPQPQSQSQPKPQPQLTPKTRTPSTPALDPDKPLPTIPSTPKSNSSKPPPTSPYSHAPQLPELHLNLSSATLDRLCLPPPSPDRASSPPRAASPTPSVLERARMFELAESRNPGARPPSPSKLSLLQDPRAAGLSTPSSAPSKMSVAAVRKDGKSELRGSDTVVRRKPLAQGRTYGGLKFTAEEMGQPVRPAVRPGIFSAYNANR